jgi:hypothetical protein
MDRPKSEEKRWILWAFGPFAVLLEPVGGGVALTFLRFFRWGAAQQSVGRIHPANVMAISTAITSSQ